MADVYRPEFVQVEGPEFTEYLKRYPRPVHDHYVNNGRTIIIDNAMGIVAQTFIRDGSIKYFVARNAPEFGGNRNDH